MLNQRIYDYDDDLKLFKEYYIKEIPYFKNVSVESLHHIIFTLQRETYEKDRKILREDDLTDKIIIVQSGIIDIETIVDDQVFVIESLKKGSILNYRNFFFQSNFKVVARSKTISTIVFITQDTLELLRSRNEDINREVEKFLELEENSKDNIDRIVLDYLLPNPEDDIRSPDYLRRTSKLTNIVKNAAIKTLLLNKKNRAPKLKDILKDAIAKMRSQESKKKDKEETESDEEMDEYNQTSYLREVIDDISNSVKRTTTIVNNIEQRLIEYEKERIRKRKARQDTSIRNK